MELICTQTIRLCTCDWNLGYTGNIMAKGQIEFCHQILED